MKFRPSASRHSNVSRAACALLSLLLILPGAMISEVNAQSSAAVAKLAKDFNVSPKLLTQFRKAGLSRVDLGNGLKIAKQVSGAKNLKMNDAATQVLSLKQGGKGWADIAKEFDIDLPTDLDLSGAVTD